MRNAEETRPTMAAGLRYFINVTEYAVMAAAYPLPPACSQRVTCGARVAIRAPMPTLHRVVATPTGRSARSRHGDALARPFDRSHASPSRCAVVANRRGHH